MIKKFQNEESYAAPEMTLFSTPVEQGFFNTYGEEGEAGDGFDSGENEYGPF